MPDSAWAQTATCASFGTLRSLSTTVDGSQSLWLSRTTGGAGFALDATDSATRVDTWFGQGLRLSRSPVVAFGSAGAHTLSEITGDGDCPIATVDQLSRPDQTLPSVPDGGGGNGIDGGGYDGSRELTESALLGFSPALLGQLSITERLTRRALGPCFGLGLAGTEVNAGRLAWVDTTVRFADNDQGGRDGRDTSTQLTLGLDVWQDETLQFGIAGGIETAQADAFGGFISSRVDSYFIGPYLGWQPDKDTLIDVWFGYLNRDYSNSVGLLDSSFDADGFFVDTNVTRQIQRGSYSILPKLGVFYASGDIPDHQYTDGSSTFGVSGADTDTLIGRVSVDVWRNPVSSSSALKWLPLPSAGIDWYAKRPGDGLLLESDLGIEEAFSLVGSLAVGTDILTRNDGRWTLKLRYDGIGLPGYDEIGGRLPLT
jgi:hypothetical protein